MAKKCKVCEHPKVDIINQQIISGDKSLSSLAKLYGMNRATLAKHRDNCLTGLMVKNEATKTALTEDILLKQVQSYMELVRKMILACDEWLTDPEDPTKYFIGARGEEIDVVYQEINPDNGRVDAVQRKATLQLLLDKIESSDRYIIRGVTSNHSDPRDLLLKAITKLENTVSLIHKSTQNLAEWEFKKKAMLKADGQDVNEISFEKQVETITEKVTVAFGKSNSDNLCKKAGLPELSVDNM